MRMDYCPRCGSPAVQREIGDEGRMNYCERCKMPLWNLFPVCIITAVFNEEDEVALIRQDYVSRENYVLVAGYMKEGETAEETTLREVEEELGLTALSTKFVASYFHEKRGQLMLGFWTQAKKADFHLSSEVDSAVWVAKQEAPAMLREGSIARKLVEACVE